jgi:hypothetical protein
MSSTAASDGYLSEVLHNARTALLAKGLYLGVPDIVLQVGWYHVGKMNYLSTSQELKKAAALDAARKNNRPHFPDHAVLSAVVLIPSEDYWLTSDGMWRGPDCSIPFAQVKPMCTGQALSHPMFLGDFQNVLKNIDNIMAKTRSKGVDVMKGVRMALQTTGERKLKFCHVLFEVR